MPPDLSGLAGEELGGLRSRLKGLMWEHLGILRSRLEMQEGAARLEALRREWAGLRDGGSDGGDGERWAEGAECRNMLDVAALVFRCALWRRESRGLHYVRDFPYRDNEAFLRDSFVRGSA